jgi:hypothetical protein
VDDDGELGTKFMCMASVELQRVVADSDGAVALASSTAWLRMHLYNPI